MRLTNDHNIFALTDGRDVRLPTSIGIKILLRRESTAGDTRVHGNDERISPKNLEDGVELLWQIVLEIAGSGQ